MSRRALLWLAFVGVHILVATAGFVLPNEPMGDVYLVYEPWADSAIHGTGIVGIDREWVYPQLALVPMVLAFPLGVSIGYPAAWAVLVTVLNAVAFAVLIGSARSRARRGAAWFWLAGILLLGPVGMYRLDAITAAIAIPALLLVLRRPVVAGVLLAAATWIKVWPAALLAAGFVALRRRVALVSGAVSVTLAIVAVALVLGASGHLFGFLHLQGERGLQVEAPASTPFLWAAIARRAGYGVVYDTDILTFQVIGDGVAEISGVLNAALVLVAGLLVIAGLVAHVRGERAVHQLPVLAFALVLALIVFNKVGSPQFQVWLFAPVVLGLVLDRRRWRVPAALVLLSCVLTLLVYPVFYGGITSPASGPVSLLTARNAILVGLLVWAATRVVSAAIVPARSRVVGQQ